MSRKTAPQYVWGEVSHGWRLMDDEALSIIEEAVPAGAGETWHVHRVARQFFYVLEGSAVILTEDGEISLAAGEGMTVMPGTIHRFTNQSEFDVRFLVVSSPSSQGDRFPAVLRATKEGVDPEGLLSDTTVATDPSQSTKRLSLE